MASVILLKPGKKMKSMIFLIRASTSRVTSRTKLGEYGASLMDKESKYPLETYRTIMHSPHVGVLLIKSIQSHLSLVKREYGKAVSGQS